MNNLTLKIRDLLRSEWDETNAIKPPTITDDDYNETLDQDITLPTISVPRITKDAQGGPSGYWAMSGVDGHPIQRFDGNVYVEFWATKQSLTRLDPNRAARTWLNNAEAEVGRIARENWNTFLPDIESIALVHGHDQHEKNRSPTIYHRISYIGFTEITD